MVRWYTKHCVLNVLTVLCLLNEGRSEWSLWGEWSSCSVTCGRGVKRRFRQCNNPPRSAAGKWCEGNPRDVEACSADFECPVDGTWSEWSEWSSCSVTCGQGERTRARRCNAPAPAFGGKFCEGDAAEVETCKNVNLCPRDGAWSSWSAWSSCSVTCGPGLQHRVRSCNNPPPTAGGQNCSGHEDNTKTCFANISCPVNGQWSGWSDWSDCSVTCGIGERQRRRSCDNPLPLYGGTPCNSTQAGNQEIQKCNSTLVNCPVDGSWSEWSEYGPCETTSCEVAQNAAQSVRHRSCNNPLPAHGGSMCAGVFLDVGICGNPTNCKVDGGWSEWSDWNCTVNLVKRTRVCDNPPPVNGGKPCSPEGGAIEFFTSKDEKFRELCDYGSDSNEDEYDLGWGDLEDEWDDDFT